MVSPHATNNAYDRVVFCFHSKTQTEPFGILVTFCHKFFGRRVSCMTQAVITEIPR